VKSARPRFPVPFRLVAIVLVAILIPSVLITALGLFAVKRAEPMVREQLAYPIEQTLDRLCDRLSREWEFRLQALGRRVDAGAPDDGFFRELVAGDPRIVDVIVRSGEAFRRPLGGWRPPAGEGSGLDPALARAWEVEFKKGDASEALIAYRALVADGPPEPAAEALFGAARCYFKLGQWRQAVAALRRLVDRFGATADPSGMPRSWPALLRIIEISRDNGDLAGEQLALRELLADIRSHGGRMDADRESFFSLRLKRYPDAQAVLEALRSPQPPEAPGAPVAASAAEPVNGAAPDSSGRPAPAPDALLEQLKRHAEEQFADSSPGYLRLSLPGGTTAVLAAFPFGAGGGTAYLRLDPEAYLRDVWLFTPELNLSERALRFVDAREQPVGPEKGGSPPASDVRPLAARVLPRPLTHLSVQYYPAPGEVTEELRRLETSRVTLFTWSIIVLVLMIVLGISLTLRSVFREMKVTRLKTDFVGFVTHELKTPLTAIRMFAETLLLDRVPDEAERRRCVELIDQEAARLSRLIEQVLEFSRIERHQKVFHFVSGDMGQVVDEAVRIFLDHNRESGCEIEVNKAQQNISRIKMDRASMVELLLNLFSNALKYSRSSKKIVVNVRESMNDITVEVVDEGIGIPKWEQRKIFGKFYRANDYLTREVEGTGLGLTFARYIAKVHSGDIRVASTVNQGSTFTLEVRKNQILAE
jgi:signal transduction histidine kinase